MSDLPEWLEKGRNDIALFAREGLGIELHPAQVEAANAILSRDYQYLLLTWANRAGKTTILCVVHMFALAYKFGMEQPQDDEDRKSRWLPAAYRTLHCAPLNVLSLKAYRELQEILKGTSVAQRDPVTGKRRPAPLLALFQTYKERDEAGIDHMILACATGGRTDFVSTQGGAARLEGEAWWLITFDEWPATEGGAENVRFLVEVRLTNRAADFAAPIVLTGTIIEDMEHLAKEWLSKCDDPSNQDWWGNHAKRSDNPSANLLSIERAARNLEQGDYDRAVLGRPGGVKGRLLPDWIVDHCFDNDLPKMTPPTDKDGVVYDAGRIRDRGESEWIYFHLWDMAISAADIVGTVLRVPRNYKFDAIHPVIGVHFKKVPGSSTLIDDEIVMTVQETFLPYGGVIYVDTTDAHGKNIQRKLTGAGYPARSFDFHDVTARGYTWKEAGEIALKSLLSTQEEALKAQARDLEVYDTARIDRDKPYGVLKLPKTWTLHRDQLSILKPPPDDKGQKKDAAMTLVMAAKVLQPLRQKGVQTGPARMTLFGRT